MAETMAALWNELLQDNKVRLYVFKTRLQRAIIETKKYSEEKNDKELCEQLEKLEDSMKYISDQSNQTSDGELRSYLILKDDMKRIEKRIIIKYCCAKIDEK